MTAATVEFTVFQISPDGMEDPLSSGHFIVDHDYGGIVFWPTEDVAKAGAVEYARKLADAGSRHRFIVRRTSTRIVWDEDQP